MILAGCEVAKTAADTAARMDRSRQFTAVSRELDPTDPNAGTFILRTKSGTEATWVDAMALFFADNQVCPEGANFSILDMSPSQEGLAKDPAGVVYPAATVFELRAQCEVAFPQEIVIEPAITQDEAFDRLRRELSGDGPFDPSRHQMTRVSYGELNPKYSALHKALGYMLARGNRECGATGVHFRKIVVLAPDTPESRTPATGHAYLGAEYGCMDRASAAPERPNPEQELEENPS
ncbi:hypothetical protein GCM10027193_18140 [Arenimonas aestuarii]